MVYLNLIIAGIITSVSLLLVTIGIVKKCKKLEGYDYMRSIKQRRSLLVL